MKQLKRTMLVLLLAAPILPILYIGIFVAHEWLKYLGVAILICSPVLPSYIFLNNNKSEEDDSDK